MVLLGSSAAHAEVKVEESCWIHETRGGVDRHIEFLLKTYTDTVLGQEVGALVQYAGSTSTIPLVFRSFVRTDMEEAPNEGNFELTRVEVVDGKVGGQYVFAQVGFGIRQGRQATYSKSRSAKPITFYYSSVGDGACAFAVN